MAIPNNECGCCLVWLALDEPEGIPRQKAYNEHCCKCELFQSQKFVRHIPTQTCYPLEEDGQTLFICGARLTPKIDGKIFWEYVDRYIPKEVTPSDPFKQ